MCCIIMELKFFYSALLFQITFGINISEKIRVSTIHTGTATLRASAFSIQMYCHFDYIQDNEILNKYSYEFRKGLWYKETKPLCRKQSEKWLAISDQGRYSCRSSIGRVSCIRQKTNHRRPFTRPLRKWNRSSFRKGLLEVYKRTQGQLCYLQTGTYINMYEYIPP